jgi:hypothetical protein
VAPRGNREKRSPQLPHRKPGWLDAPAIRQLRCQSSRKLLSYSRQNWIVSKRNTANNVVEVETSLGKKKLHSCVKPTTSHSVLGRGASRLYSERELCRGALDSAPELK